MSRGRNLDIEERAPAVSRALSHLFPFDKAAKKDLVELCLKLLLLDNRSTAKCQDARIVHGNQRSCIQVREKARNNYPRVMTNEFSLFSWQGKKSAREENVFRGESHC